MVLKVRESLKNKEKSLKKQKFKKNMEKIERIPAKTEQTYTKVMIVSLRTVCAASAIKIKS